MPRQAETPAREETRSRREIEEGGAQECSEGQPVDGQEEEGGGATGQQAAENGGVRGADRNGRESAFSEGGKEVGGPRSVE